MFGISVWKVFFVRQETPTLVLLISYTDASSLGVPVAPHAIGFWRTDQRCGMWDYDVGWRDPISGLSPKHY
jgi:hypothetical protein